MSLNFQTIKGDTFEAVNFQININGSAYDLTDCIIKMQLRKECGSAIALSLTSVDDSGITIYDATNGNFRINEQIIDCASGVYNYDIEITFADGSKKTYISGVFNVTCDITR